MNALVLKLDFVFCGGNYFFICSVWFKTSPDVITTEDVSYFFLLS